MSNSIISVDVLIVGSGPAGTSTALHLLQQDPGWASRVIIVDKAVHPREKLCGGGVTHLGTNALARLGLSFEPDHFVVREARLVYRDLHYSFWGNPVFRVTRRDEFDHWLVQQVEQQGVTVRQGEAVKDIVPGDDFVTVTTSEATFHAQVVVAADGSKSFVRRRLKWDDDSRVARLLEVLTPEDSQRQPEFRDKMAIFDFTSMTDGLQGYYWDFPSFVAGKSFMNRGVFDSRSRPERDKADLKQTLGDAMAERERDLQDYKLKGHPIRWFDPRGKFSIPRVILAGDAAGVDPLFGEGISFALAYGEVAADAIQAAFDQADFSFADYRQRLMASGDFQHLAWRTRLARLAYRKLPVWLVKLGWRLAPLVVRLTPWRDPEYDPHREPDPVRVSIEQQYAK
jgi:geranylgeranyl reductase family protein